MSKRKTRISQKSNLPSETALDELIVERERQNRPKGYSEYLAETIADARGEYESEMRKASGRYARALPGYGSVAESLSKRGLLTSGYADYLGEAAGKRLASDGERAMADYDDAIAEGERSYRAYLEKEEAAEDEILRRAIRRMTSDGIDSYDQGYRIGVSEGLSGERAELFARMCDAYGASDSYGVSGSERITLLREIMQNGLDYESAYLYARAVGASSATAKRIAEFAVSARGDLGSLLTKSE